MNAIIPLNVAAIRVSKNDRTNIVTQFQGKTAAFEKMPWYNPELGQPPRESSTGDQIYRPLTVVNGNPAQSPINPLDPGVHLQWELPDYFRKGHQPAEGGNIEFPAAPNRWLVVRYLSIYNPQSKQYESATSKMWVVESDYVALDRTRDKYGILRPVISVPLPAQAAYQQQPYHYMGRVVEYEDWDPSSESPADYLPAYNGLDGKPLYLTSVGFVGAHFGSYYPECISVFGFWDHFSDVEWQGQTLYNIIQQNEPIQFRAAYQVIGWLNDVEQDPMDHITAEVTESWNEYLNRCNANGTQPELTPTDFFNDIVTGEMRWKFNLDDISYTLNPDNTIDTLNVPTQTLVSGIAQEVVWNMLENPQTTYFLSSKPTGGSVWDSEVHIGVGNSTVEAVSALLKYDMGQNEDDHNVLTNYEYLLDAVQLGLLSELERTPNKLIKLEEALHSNAFSTFAGGYVWQIVNTVDNDGSTAPNPGDEITLPLTFAEMLYLLNQAQKNYDMGRAGLTTMRQQLFMDWYRYLKMYVGETTNPYVTQSAMDTFMYTSGGGELNKVIDEGNKVGILLYDTDHASGAVTGIQQPGSSVSTDSLAYAVWTEYNKVLEALQAAPDYVLQCAPATSFYQPQNPVVLMEGDMMEPVARNGSMNTVFARLSQEILDELGIQYKETDFTINAAELSVPEITKTPMSGDVQALAGEAFLLVPLLAADAASALAAQGGDNNPATESESDFRDSLMYAQGGLSPLDTGDGPGEIPLPDIDGLFGLLSGEDYVPAENPVIQTDGPQQLNVTFTNGAGDGWPAAIQGWTTQQALPELSATRVDPFMPIFMIWTVQFNPLKWEGSTTPDNPTYSATNLTDFFELDEDAVDYTYKMDGDQPVDFTSPLAVKYGNSSTMNPNSTGVLVYQINNYIANHPDDPADPVLRELAEVYKSKRFLSQGISGFNVQQLLTTMLAQVAVQDLTLTPRDMITQLLAQAATGTPNDNWYAFGFNNMAPISTGLLAQGNFGPLRSGFMEIVSIEIVDVFGQRMDLFTEELMPNGNLSVTTAFSMTPPEEDTEHKGQIYLPPRMLSPTRLWFRWLSATHNDQVEGVDSDFVEMNSHPATSPICGWVLPNHLDNNLFFYDADGTAIGTFGVEHTATEATLTYRTRAGNRDNPNNSLETDIGPPGEPTVNAHLANYMWYIDGQSAKFLADLMSAIHNSDVFINPSNFSQDSSLSVLIGRPLVLTRAVLGIETPGNLLPLNQSADTADSPFNEDVNNGRTDYRSRMEYSAAGVQNVEIPLRLGDLPNLDDGLVGYLLETDASNPYLGQTFWSPAATDSMNQGVEKPAATNIQLKANAEAISVTMLVDPRAGVHATTGVLPVNELSIPPDQYTQTLNGLSVNFTARPMLEMAQGLIVPLPQESGYAWSWVTPGSEANVPLAANAGNETPVYGYSPQTLLEGWVELSPDQD